MAQAPFGTHAANILRPRATPMQRPPAAAGSQMYPAGPDSMVVGSRAFNVDEEALMGAQQNALAGLREAAGVQRDLRTEDRGAQLDDARMFGMDEAELGEDLADYRVARGIPREGELSEAAAAREFMPGAGALHERGRREVLEDVRERFQVPAEIASDAAIGASGLQAEGRIGAAQIGAETSRREALQKAMLDGLMRAITASIQQRGGEFDPENIKGLDTEIQRMFGGLR